MTTVSRTLTVVALLTVLGVGIFVMTRPQAREGPDMNALAERYVRLVLAMGQHDADYVDAYYGPPEWRKEAEATKMPLAGIDAAAVDLAAALATGPSAGEDSEAPAEEQ